MIYPYHLAFFVAILTFGTYFWFLHKSPPSRVALIPLLESSHKISRSHFWQRISPHGNAEDDPATDANVGQSPELHNGPSCINTR